MTASLQASTSGLARIKQARKEKGWTIEDERWLLGASKIVEPDKEWPPGSGYYADGCSEKTWKRFLRGTSISAVSFKAFCQVLGLDWEAVVDRPFPSTTSNSIDWDVAPDVSTFYGRCEELAALQQWLVGDRCRLVAVVGMGGAGKTSLSVKLVQQVAPSFDRVVWRSLRYAPPLSQLLPNLLQFLCQGQPTTNLPPTGVSGISQLIDVCRRYRCLLVLDNWESVLQDGCLVGGYREGYEDYAQLLRSLGETEHQSCLLLTSWDKPKEIAQLERDRPWVRSWQLDGLGVAALEIFKAKGLSEEQQWLEIIRPYKGHPLALNIVATTIQDVFGGSVKNFLRNNTMFLGDFEYLLSEQLQRLSEVEGKLLVCLAKQRGSVSFEQLRQEAELDLSSSDLIKAVESLVRRSLLETVAKEDETFYTMPPVLTKYVTSKYSYVK